MGKVTETVEPAGDLFVKPWTPEGPFRNPARIPTMLELMRSVWAVEENTDMRMGQLLMNAARLGGWPGDDIWNCEEEIFAAGFLKMLAMDSEEGA